MNLRIFSTLCCVPRIFVLIFESRVPSYHRPSTSPSPAPSLTPAKSSPFAIWSPVSHKLIMDGRRFLTMEGIYFHPLRQLHTLPCRSYIEEAPRPHLVSGRHNALIIKDGNTVTKDARPSQSGVYCGKKNTINLRQQSPI